MKKQILALTVLILAACGKGGNNNDSIYGSYGNNPNGYNRGGVVFMVNRNATICNNGKITLQPNKVMTWDAAARNFAGMDQVIAVDIQTGQQMDLLTLAGYAPQMAQMQRYGNGMYGNQMGFQQNMPMNNNGYFNNNW